MKRQAYFSLLIIPIILLFGSSVYGGWKNKVALNQVKAKAANRENREAMDQAEKLARSGKYRLIETPQFKPIVSDEGYSQARRLSGNPYSRTSSRVS